jgi:hypothetical protein
MIAYIFNPRLSVTEFYQHLATLFDIRNWESKSDLLFELGKVLESRHSRGLRTVLIVDEAHGLSTQVLEEIRLLCNFESDTAKQLQIVLTGQPELREVLNNPELRQLKQRVALRCEIKALPTVEETDLYIKSRLRVAGASREIFSPGAVDYIFRCTAGIPRAINNVCDNAMLNGFAASEQMISRAMIQEVAETFDILPRTPKVQEPESSARVFPAASRAELWSMGNGNGNGNGHAHRAEPESQEFVRIPSYPDDITFNERAPLPTAPSASSFSYDTYTAEKSSTHSNGSDVLGRNNNGQSL